MMNRKQVFATVFILLLFPPVIQADNWPQFRGPDHQGHSSESGLPLKWSETENVAWRIELPGQSWSSPIVWGNRVFVTTTLNDGVSCRVLSIDSTDGSIQWNKEVFEQTLLRKEDRNTYATPTPATDGEKVYACFGDGSFVALNYAGDIVWKNRDHPFYGQHGLGTSPILYDGMLIMARDGSSDGQDKKLGWQTPWDQSYVVAIDTATGKDRWIGKRGMSRISHGAPCIWEQNGSAQVVSEAGDVVQGFDCKTGERIWSCTVAGEGKVPSTIIGDGFVFTSGGWGGKESIKAFKLGGHGELNDSSIVWEQKKGIPKIPSMIYVKPYVFAITDAGIATCLRSDTGDIVWQNRLGGNFSASPVSSDGRIYFLADNGETTIIEAGPEFRVIAKNPLGERVQASPAISNGKLFIRTDRHLFCIGQDSPIIRSEFIFEEASFPSAHASTIVETADGTLLTAWFGGKHENHPGVGIWVSRMVNNAWTPPVEVANGVQYTKVDGTVVRHPTWNPVLFQPKSGPLLLFFKAGPSPQTWWGLLTTSSDNGKTWTTPRRLPEGILGPVKNKPIELANGDMVCPSSTETPDTDLWRVHMELTSDQGITWRRTEPLNDGKIFGAIQPSLMKLGPTEILAVGRTGQNCVFQMKSKDGGSTWSEMQASSLPNPDSGVDAVTLSDSRQLLVYNHVSVKPGVEGERSPLNVAISRDGVAWQAALKLEDSPKEEFSYPAVIQTRDGLVHITYTWNRKKIRHVVVDPKKIQPVDFTQGNWPQKN